MAHELEVSVLDIEKQKIERLLKKAGTKRTERSRLVVDWYRLKGVKEGKGPWYLRIRSYSGKRYEVTWKAKSDAAGIARKHKEINFDIAQPEALADLFEELGLEQYAHQEKDRTSY